MSPAMDPRLVERRRTVREHGARKRLRRVVGLLSLLGLAAAAIWLVQSPVLAVRSIAVDGMDRARALAIAESAGAGAGDPIVFVRARRLRAALLAEPAVREARVEVRWPGSIDIAVLLHEPVAWVGSGERWAQATAGGAVVAVADVPPPWAPRVVIPTRARPGGVVVDAMALVALEFVSALPGQLAQTVRITADDDQLWAQIAGHTVRLGFADEPDRKAGVVAAIFEAGVEPGAVIDVLAPSRPAVLLPVVAEGSLGVRTESGETEDEVEG